jgi:ribosomal protein S18 acetylase RimI-like enzyme
VEIVELSPDDVRRAADDLARLLLDAHADNMALGLAAPLDAARARETWLATAERLGTDRVLLAARDGDAGSPIAGAVQLVRATAANGRHRGEIQRLAVRADHRGRGLGRALLAAAVDRARRDGLRLLWLTTHDGTAADGFYESAGWTRVGVIPSYSVRPDGTLAANVFFYLEL